MSGYAFANLNSPAPDFLEWRWSSVRRVAFASRSRRMRCSPPSIIALPDTAPLPRDWVSALSIATSAK